MIEADGENQNGGIFAITTQKCEGENCQPKLIQKFGNWDEKVENFGKYGLKVNQQVLLGAVENIKPNFDTEVQVNQLSTFLI